MRFVTINHFFGEGALDRSLETLCAALVSELKLGQTSDIGEVRPLTGGVASDIALVRVGDADYCMKFAREKLQVAEDWFAPLHRNEAEYAWLKFVGSIYPECAPKLFGESTDLNGFAMEFVSGEDVFLWKDVLLKGEANPKSAKAVAECLGKIHSASAKPEFDRSKFDNRDDFKALRLEPYLLFLATQHPDLKEQILSVEADLYESSSVLVHGDVSPKNIMFKAGYPIMLDAECATMGDASFDASFCLNHLVLKAAHSPTKTTELLGLADTFWGSYSSFIDWEDAKDLEQRICRLLPILMLARIDGKSPVEYLSDEARVKVRKLAVSLIQKSISEFSVLLSEINKGLS